MKKYSFMSFLLLFMAVVSVSCSSPTLNDYVEGFKGEMPQDMGSGLTMTDVGIVDDYVQIEATSDESELDLANPMVSMVLPAVAEPVKASFIENADMKDFIQACSDEGKGFRMVVTGAKSEKTVTLFEFTPEDINKKFPPRTKE